MCEKPASLQHDLGRQEPRGCRYIYGDPGVEDGWHFCQRTLVKDARPGDALHPPYCARHTKVCMTPAKPVHLFPWYDRNIVQCTPERGDGQRLAVDTFMKIGSSVPSGASKHV